MLNFRAVFLRTPLLGVYPEIRFETLKKLKIPPADHLRPLARPLAAEKRERWRRYKARRKAKRAVSEGHNDKDSHRSTNLRKKTVPKRISPQEQQKLAVDGLSRLAEYAGQLELNVIVENHGGLSSDGAWLAGVMKQINRPNAGTLPDFGNFHDYDRYKGVEELMPYAKGVSAKSHDFDINGDETKTDYRKMLKLVLDAGYHGYVGVEYEGKTIPEPEGIKATKALLEKVRDEMSTA